MAAVTVMTVGSHGDVAPLVGLAQRLAAEGHRVRFATTHGYGDLVTASGLAFHCLPGPDPRENAATEEGQAAARPGVRGVASLIRVALRVLRAQTSAMRAAARDADVVLCNQATAMFAAPVAEARGVPCVVLGTMPMEPSRHLGPLILGGRNLGAWANRALPVLVGQLGSLAFRRFVRELRAEEGLPAAPAPGARPDELPALLGFSPAVVPRPPDWRPEVEITGYWWPPRPEGWVPDPELVRFLAAGPPPVFVGFGSAGSGEGERLSEVVGAALRRVGVRAIVQRGWAGLAVEGPDVLTVDEVPHDWLFGRVAAVVHHAGAGTTAAGLRASVPAVPVPFAWDQPFWAARLVSLGVAPRAVPARGLRAEDLADAIAVALGAPAHRHAAAELARRVDREDGVAPVLAALSSLAQPPAVTSPVS